MRFKSHILIQLIRTALPIWLSIFSIPSAGEDPVTVEKISGHYEEPESMLKLECSLKIPAPWYINSDSAALPWLIVTKMALMDSSKGSLVKKEYPAPVQKTLFKENMEVFTGDLHFKNYFHLKPETVFPVRAYLQYQSCDGKMCYPPRYRNFIIEKIDEKISISLSGEI